MAEMTAHEARARLKPFEDGMAALVKILDVAARAEAAEGQALARSQDAERRIAQAALRADKADADAEARVKEAEERVQRAVEALQRRLGETKATLEGQVVHLTEEVAAERQRLAQIGEQRGQAQRELEGALAGFHAEAKATRASLADQQATFERQLADLEDRIAQKRAEYREIVEKIQAIRV